MRLFIGLTFAPTTLEQISNYRDKAILSQSKNVAVSNFHITLCFLGAVDKHRPHHLTYTSSTCHSATKSERT